mmetsp:Transcript_27874/g.56170  ORF Transcript_27874/g.56170 Transcript_27874/m.56170 type:complete len:291 (-) Transcript_27874:76-948(-)
MVSLSLPFLVLLKSTSQLHVNFAAASVLFWVPVLREYLLLFGGREANRSTVKRLLAAGHIVAVCPGGVWEQVHTDRFEEKVFVQRNKGFLRLALEASVPVMPMYGFGENQLYSTSLAHLSWRQHIAKKYRVGLPWIVPSRRLAWGFGRVGLGLGPVPCTLPHPTHVVHVLGAPVFSAAAPSSATASTPSETVNAATASAASAASAAARKRKTNASVATPTRREGEVDEKAVKRLFGSYKASLFELFNKHKTELLPPDVASKGLRVIWLGDEDKKSKIPQETKVGTKAKAI